jgi:hypothetical protein
VIFGWSWISRELYGGKYVSIGALAWLWGGNVVLGSVAVALNAAMLSLSQFRLLALIDLAGAAVCSASLVGLLSRFGYETSVIGTMVGQASQIVLMGIALTSLPRRAKAL